MRLTAPELPEYEVFSDRQNEGSWRAEAVSRDGTLTLATFTGPTAEADAYEYAAFKNGDL